MPSKTLSNEPNLFSYTDFRVYLRDFYAWKKQILPAFSYRFFSRKAGLGSPNYLKLVMDGSRNLSHKSLTAFLRGLDLAGPKAEYFENLVLYNQAPDETERNHFFQKLVKYRIRLGLKPLEAGQLRLFSSWFPMVIREMTALQGFRKTPAWISKALKGRVSAQEAEMAFELLLELGLLKKTDRGFESVDTHITTRDEVSSEDVKTYHRHMIRLGMESLDLESSNRRDISALTFPIRQADFPRVKERLQLLRKELLNLAATQGEGEMVVQVNFQLFPLAEVN